MAWRVSASLRRDTRLMWGSSETQCAPKVYKWDKSGRNQTQMCAATTGPGRLACNSKAHTRPVSLLRLLDHTVSLRSVWGIGLGLGAGVVVVPHVVVRQKIPFVNQGKHELVALYLVGDALKEPNTSRATLAVSVAECINREQQIGCCWYIQSVAKRMPRSISNTNNQLARP